MAFRFMVNKNPLTIEFEVDSIAAGLAILTESKTQLSAAFDEFRASADEDDGDGTVETLGEGKPKRRGGRRKSAESSVPTPPVPAAATDAPPPPVAPAPLPVPATAAAANSKDGLEIPLFLDRRPDAQAGAVSAAPPPPPVAPAPVPPQAESALRNAVIAELNKRKAASVDNGAQLAGWLVACGLVMAGTTYDEAIVVLQFTEDAKLAPIAKALQIG